jgi:RNA polymerase subunit RPABC4/transcription elongation factor Spt4
MMEALAAGVIGLALLWLVAQPMLFPSTLVAEPFEPPDPEETPRGQALLALKEIEFDRATGKLSETDFNQLHTKYSAAAIAVLEPAGGSPVGDDAVEALITARAASGKGVSAGAGKVPGPRCLTHGTTSEPGARFCPACGSGLLATAGTCLGCGTAVPGDSIFCPGCGVRVRSA